MFSYSDFNFEGGKNIGLFMQRPYSMESEQNVHVHAYICTCIHMHTQCVIRLTAPNTQTTKRLMINEMKRAMATGRKQVNMV